jgi:hypothetical protein
MSEDTMLKSIILSSGKEIIGEIEYRTDPSVYFVEFPLLVTTMQSATGNAAIRLSRYVLSADYDRAMILMPTAIECMATVNDQMVEEYEKAKDEYFGLDDLTTEDSWEATEETFH